MSGIINFFETLFNDLEELHKLDKAFCDVFPPGIDSFTSIVVNLPVIVLWILTLPPRTFLCLIASIGEVNPLALLINLFPPITMFCSVCPGQSSSCFQCSNYCNESSECITLPQSYINLCRQTQKYFSLLNQVFCLIGYVMLSIALPLVQIINFILVFTGHQICISLNPNNCIPGDNS